MRAERLAINSQCTFHWDLEEALDAYAAAGFRNVEPHLNLVKGWLDDGHTVDEARELFASRDLSVVASSQLEVMCFGSPDARMPNLRANAENSRAASTPSSKSTPANVSPMSKDEPSRL